MYQPQTQADLFEDEWSLGQLMDRQSQVERHFEGLQNPPAPLRVVEREWPVRLRDVGAQEGRTATMVKAMQENNEHTQLRFRNYTCLCYLIGFSVMLYLPTCLLGCWWYVINPDLQAHVSELRKP